MNNRPTIENIRDEALKDSGVKSEYDALSPKYEQERQRLLHERLDAALEDVKAGNVIDGREVMDNLRKKYFSD